MKRKTRKTLKIIFFLAIAIIGARVYINYHNDVEAYNKRITELTEKIREQKEYGEELDSREDVYSSEESVERIARDTLGMVKSNERFFKNYNDNH